MTIQGDPHFGKSLTIEVDGQQVARYPVRTHVVTADDDLTDVVSTYAAGQLRPGDMLFLSERMVAITQGRAFRVTDIAPSRAARVLYKFIHRSPYGIGLGSPWTMELAIREAGLPRILTAAAAAAVTRAMGVRGVFYRVAGAGVAAIDGPCAYTLPPYDGYAVLGPADPTAVARRLQRQFGVPVVIIDANDLGVNVLAVSDPAVPVAFAAAAFRDNPLGQGRQQTPMGIVRRIGAEPGSEPGAAPGWDAQREPAPEPVPAMAAA